MGIKISNLPETTEARETDVIIVSGEDTKKLQYSNLITQLIRDLNIGRDGSSALVITRAYKGMPVRIVTDGIFATVDMHGQPDSDINIKTGWTTVGNFAAEELTPVAETKGIQFVNVQQFAVSYRWLTDGTFQIGFGNTGDRIESNFRSGGLFDLSFTFSLK